MQGIEKRVINHKYKLIADSVNPNDLTDDLLARNVLNGNDHEELESIPKTSERVERFIAILKSKRHGYQAFIEWMKKQNMDWVVTEMEEEYDKLKHDGGCRHVLTKLDPNKIDKKLKEIQCMKLCKAMGSEFEKVAIELDISTNDVEILKADTQKSGSKEYHLLMKWTQTKGDEANLTNLLKVYDSLGIDYEEMDALEKYFG